MSRRPPNPAAERAAQNQQTIKSLLKLESNKICADCKRNKHPRWASWNLGVFICIRCSGIHRGMGTHISRVKSVDLDSWTDEQLQSILSWGNARANKYWEAKLAAGHVPSEAKIENFIRTKYDLKRWVMDGPMPDPATLDAEGDDDIPLSLVKEKQNIERKESIRKSSVGKSAAPSPAPVEHDLIGGDPDPPRASTVGPVTGKVPPKAGPAPPKTTNNTKDSLLGLDFLGGEPAAPPRPASTSATGGLGGPPSRPDLKQSILSLYATAPRPQTQQQPSGMSSSSFSGMQSPAMGGQTSPSGGGLNDAFSSLSFGNTSQTKSPPPDPFANLGKPAPNRPTSTSSMSFSNLGGGSFFNNPKPASSQSPHQSKQSVGSSSGFGAFASPAAPPKSAAPSSSAFGDLFDLSSPAPSTQPAIMSPPLSAPINPTPPAAMSSSAFNLTSTQPKPQASNASASNPVASTGGLASANWSNADIWGGSEWNTAEPSAPAKAPEPPKPSTTLGAADFGWGSSGGSFASQSIVPGNSGGFNTQPKVAADEEFGGWASSTGATTNNTSGSKPVAGFGTNEDLFSNVWQ